MGYLEPFLDGLSKLLTLACRAVVLCHCDTNCSDITLGTSRLPGGVAQVLMVKDWAWQHVTHLLHPSNQHGGQPGCGHILHAKAGGNTAQLERKKVMATITMIQEKITIFSATGE